MNIIFQISGGIGKCILATSVCEAIHEEYPNDNLIVMSGYPEVFLNNPFVHRSFAFETAQYFYQDYIEGKDFIVFAQEPYLDAKHLRNEEHLSATWARMFDVPAPTNTSPQLFLTQREIDFYAKKYSSDKPIMLLQTNGGAVGQELKYSWARDIPSHVVVDVINEFKNDYNIVHMRREDQPNFEFTTPISDGFRGLCVLIALSEKRLLMDSFGQHAAAGLNKPSTVLWVVNSPVVFGYDIHQNIQCNPFTRTPELRSSYLNKFNIVGSLVEFPYHNESEIFNTEQVIESLKNQ